MPIPVTRLEGTRVAARDDRRFEGTMVGRPPQQLRSALPTLEDAALWSETFERLGVWRAEHIDRAGMAVLVRTTLDGVSRFDVTLVAADDAPAAVIIGRHARADVLLPTDGSESGAGSLRHAAVMLWPGVGGKPPRALAVDLNTSTGLAMRDGQAARRLSSETALHFGTGDAEIFVLVAARDRPFAVRYADELDAHVSGALVERDARPTASPGPPPAWEASVVMRGHTQAILNDGLIIRASRDDVARGIVLGRYHRCHQTAAMARADTVSRVHALVFAVEDALWLVDTGSTAGTTAVDALTHARRRLGEGHRITRLSPTDRVLLADVEVQIDAGMSPVR